MITWPLAKTYPTSQRGLVAAKHPIAAEVGASVLRRGGSAIDAAVATSFAAGVVEPYMSGLGGGGLAVYQPRGETPRALHFGMRAPSSATPEMYDLLPIRGDSTRFHWLLTRGDANVYGPRSVAVPGQVAGLRRLWEMGGRIQWRDLIQPAISLATDGFPVDWLTSLRILYAQPLLSRFPASQATFLPEGRPPVPDLGLGAEVLRQPGLAYTLDTIASDPSAVCSGAIAGSIAEATNGRITADDLQRNGPMEAEALSLSFAGTEVHGVPWATGGPTAMEWLGILRELDPPPDDGDPRFWWAIVKAGEIALRDRLELLGDPDYTPFPSRILDQGYCRRVADSIRAGEASPLTVPVPDGSTTHLAVVDAEGNAVTVTQTLLALWGSGVTARGSGILLNDGMMWFDPESGHPNSIAADKRPMTNMSPLIVTADGDPFLVFGASGGRKIVCALVQILLRVTLLDQSLAEAIAAPRLDITEPDVLADMRFDAAFCDSLARTLQRRVIRRAPALGASPWASSVGLIRQEDGAWTGGADPYTMACVVSA